MRGLCFKRDVKLTFKQGWSCRLGAIFLCLTGSVNTFASCRPPVDLHAPQYIVGYGSLINTKSKSQTHLKTGDNIPVVVSGYERGWFARRPGKISMTFLGAAPKKTAKFNGVVFNLLDPQAIFHYDVREATYCREAVPLEKIHNLSQYALPPNGQYWIYIPILSSQQKPSIDYPIVQSYLDVFISGCLDIQKKYKLTNFAYQCVELTTDWSKHWVNDRIYPRRPFIYQPDADLIDDVLKKNLPNYFNSIKIE